ncbi:MAG: polysaccharide biosynthesis tyrosine autokinase, partial [Leptolyngbyaceae bacterium]|nr:polysaccharide biosynthesis tyrosine autokinase [Leptolyngbyaceae bacterium]
VDNATQLNLMRSSVLLKQAVTLLELNYPSIDVEELKSSLKVSQVVEDDHGGGKKVNTKIFAIAYTDSDPVKTQTVLHALQRVYQNYNLEQQQQRLDKGFGFINEQLPHMQHKVNQAEASLEQFREQQNLIDPALQAKALTERLNTIQQEQQTTRTKIRHLQAQYTSLQQQLGRSPQDALIASRLSQSSRYQSLLDEIQKTELALVKERLRFQDNAPTIQDLLAQRQNQRRVLQREVGRVLQNELPPIQTRGEALLKQGQLGSLDLGIANKLAEAQVELQALQAQSRSLLNTEQQLRAELNRFPNLMAEFSRLQPEVEINRATLQELLKARQDLGLELARNKFDWQVVEQPELGERIAPDLKQNLLLGIVAGLTLGAIATFLREAIDDSVHTSDDLKKQVDWPLLGMVPELMNLEAQEPIISLPFRKSLALAPSTPQVMDWMPFREALDLLYKNIQLLNSASVLKSLVFTSALAGEGKSTLALGLAMSAARLHQRVLLIDADLRRPSLHKQLNLPNEQGLATLLTSETPLQHFTGIQQITSPSDIRIAVLTSGPTPADPAKLLSSQRMAEIMAAFEQSYDLVILDAPPVLGIVDAILVASFCKGVVMTGRIGQVTRSELSQAAAMLNRLNVIGLVANGANSPIYNYPPYPYTDRRHNRQQP